MSIRQLSLLAALAGSVLWPAAAVAPALCYCSAAAAADAAIRQFTD